MKIAELNKDLSKYRITNEIFVVITNVEGDEKIFYIDRVTSYGDRVFIELGDEVEEWITKQIILIVF